MKSSVTLDRILFAFGWLFLHGILGVYLALGVALVAVGEHHGRTTDEFVGALILVAYPTLSSLAKLILRS